jgi:broad specificity phosphatase PhoE
LNERGRQQAEALARRLSGMSIGSVHTSDLRRARDTALVAVRPHRLEPLIEPRLRELDFGAWEGHTYEEVRAGYGQALAAWEEDPLVTSPPGGETLQHLSGRLRSFVDDVIRPRDPADRTLLIVAHRGALRVLLCLIQRLPVTAHWQFGMDSASLSVLEMNRRGATIVVLNDTGHLREDAHAG